MHPFLQVVVQLLLEAVRIYQNHLVQYVQHDNIFFDVLISLMLKISFQKEQQIIKEIQSNVFLVFLYCLAHSSKKNTKKIIVHNLIFIFPYTRSINLTVFFRDKLRITTSCCTCRTKMQRSWTSWMSTDTFDA